MSSMRRLELLSRLATPNDSKLLLWVLDGVGGVPDPQTGQTELERARLPHMDAFARRAACGAHEPYGAGVATGSGHAHLALFGYPLDEIDLPRGVLEVLGSSLALRQGQPTPVPALQPSDLALRGNFARLVTDAQGRRVVEDRRANALTSEQAHELLLALSRSVELPEVELFWVPGREHRFALIMRGPGLHAGVSDADPLRSGLAPVRPAPLRPEAARAASLIGQLMDQADDLLAPSASADTLLLRGAGHLPTLPTLPQLYGLRCAALATYPVYRGIAQLVGMDVIPVPGDDPQAQLDALRQARDRYDLCFFHIKETDNAAHQGDFAAKVAELERSDARFGQALAMGFDVVMLTGDHCTPSLFAEHSWHPVPTALWSRHVLSGRAQAYTERECMGGTLGLRPASDLMPLMLAEARRLKKLGA